MRLFVLRRVETPYIAKNRRPKLDPRTMLRTPGRSQIVAITKSGKAIRKRMWPVYAAALQSAVGDNLSDREAQMLGDLLGNLLK